VSGRDGFARADVDTGFFHDTKMLALARRQKDHVRTACSAMLYQATMLTSWKAGHRVTLEEGAPAWWLDDPAEYLADLQAVQLLDAEGRVPEHAFQAWAGRLIDQQERAAAAGREGARRRWHPHEPAEPLGSGSVPDGEPNGEPIAPPMHQPASLPAGQPASMAGLAEPRADAREAQPPPAGAEAPSSAAPALEEELVLSSPVWWPLVGAKPATLGEAEANLATVKAQRIPAGDARRRQAEGLVRELTSGPSNGTSAAVQVADPPEPEYTL
jgi:hypothetical protein